MPKKRELLTLLDMDNQCHASYHAYKRLSWKGESVSIIYGLPSIIKGYIWRDKPDRVMGVWDGARSQHRIQVLPNYKGHRNKTKQYKLFDREAYEKQKLIARKMLYYLGIPQVLNPAVEGDDMLYRMVRWGKKNFDQVMIVSGDKDFHQLIDDQVSVWVPSKQNLITTVNCKKYYNYDPSEAVDYLTLVGDDSDDIPGYPGIGPKKARELLDKYGTLEDFLDSEDKHSIIDRTTLLGLKYKNQYLIDLPYFYSKHKSEIKIKFYKGESSPAIQKKEFQRICGKYGLRKFMGSTFLEEFIELRLKQD